MYIREAIKKVGSKRYRYFQLVKGVVTPEGPRQTHLLSLGDLTLDSKKWPVLCRQIEAGMRGEETMLVGEEDDEVRRVAEGIVGRLRRKQGRPPRVGTETARIEVEKVEVEQAREVGPVYVGWEMWKRLGMERIMKSVGMGERMRRLCAIEVIGRLVEAGSERWTAEWFKRVGMEDVWGEEMGGVSEDALYRASDALLSQKEGVERELAKEEETMFGEENHLVLYDLTSVYFEGSGKGNEKAKRGHNREGRSDCVQVVVGLVLDGKGRVKSHEVFEGNRTDVKSLEEMVGVLEKRTGGKKGTVVMDRGICSEANLKFLRDSGYTYVVATRRSEEDRWLKEEVYREICERALSGEDKPVRVAGWKVGGEQYLFCHSEGRKKKEEAIRTRFEKRMEEALKKLGDLIAARKIVDEVKIHERIGRIRQRNSRVARWYDVRLEKEGNARRLVWSHRAEESQEHARWNGSYLIRTNRLDWADDELWKIYMLLTCVEAAFRNFKTNLGVRPVFHKKQTRTDAHIFISVLAYHLLHAIETTLRAEKDSRSWPTIRACLSTHQAVTITMPRVDGSRVVIRKQTKPETEHLDIYRKLKLPPRAFPQRRLIVEPAKS